MPMLRLSHVKEYLSAIPDDTIVGRVGSTLTTTQHPFCNVLKQRTGRPSQITYDGTQWVLSVGRQPPRVRYSLSNQMQFLAELLTVWNKETQQTQVSALTLRRMVKLANKPSPTVSPAGQMIRTRFP